MAAVNALTLAAQPDLALSASQQRQQGPLFIARCAFTALVGKLPLRWPTPPDVLPSPKPRYRSHYQPPDPARLARLDEADWRAITLFDLMLLLIDFSGLRSVLAAKLYRASARGRVPFDPVSFVLLLFWQTCNRWHRTTVLAQLRASRNQDYALAFGFEPGAWPSESGLRYFVTTIGRKYLGDLIKQSMELVVASGVVPSEVLEHAVVAFDGQLLDAASRLRCHQVQPSCYEPTSPECPRTCPAKAEGKEGCDCDSTDCRLACKRATPWDPEARYVFHERSNRHDRPDPSTGPAPVEQTSGQKSSAAKPPEGEEHYGYSSLAGQLSDPIQRTDWTLGEAPTTGANAREERRAAELLVGIVQDYPWLHVEVAVGDAGLGYEPFLRTAAQLHVRRVVDLRADPRTDPDKDQWALRGYDNVGWPVCQLGYRLRPNGFDADRFRYKWYCQQACEGHSPSQQPAAAPACPYRDRSIHPYGRIINVGETFRDGSYRLVRDVPYGSPVWQLIYHRGRNASEERNSQLGSFGLKRLPVFGTPRVQATIFLADVLGNLLTLARLVKEATLAALANANSAG
jgi:hypothetical protein